jgi:hypothetical protein
MGGELVDFHTPKHNRQDKRARLETRPLSQNGRQVLLERIGTDIERLLMARRARCEHSRSGLGDY